MLLPINIDRSQQMAETIINSTKRVAIVTGANKGIGYEICKQLAFDGITVVLTARDEKRGNDAVEKLKSQGLTNVLFCPLDVLDKSSIASLAEFVKNQFGKIDILVNNAGVLGSIIDGNDQVLKFAFENIRGPNVDLSKKFIKQTYETSEICLRTNYYGVKKVTETLLPILELSDSPRIVNISSLLGQLKMVKNEKATRELGDANGLTEEGVDKVVEEFLHDVKEDLVEANNWPIVLSAYIVSKAALNGYTRVLADKYSKIAINAVNPGYTTTDLNGNTGLLTTEDAVEGPVMLSLMSDNSHSGLFFDQTRISDY